MRHCAILSAILALAGAAGASLDLAAGNIGLSLGNSPCHTGIRLNAVDDEVVSVNGINLTLWNPDMNPGAAHRGLSLGLIGPRANTIDGLALGGLGAVAHERLTGVGAAPYGVATDRLWGGGAGLFLVEARKSLVGVGLAGLKLRAPAQVWGIAASAWRTEVGNATGAVFGAGFAEARRVRGIQLGTISSARSLNGLSVGVVFADVLDTGPKASDRDIQAGLPFDAVSRGFVVGGLGSIVNSAVRGVVAGGVFAYAADLTGVVASPLVAVGGGRLRGLALGLGGAYADDLRGIAIGGLGIGTGKDVVGAALSAGYAETGARARGLLVGGVAALARERLDGVALSLGGVGSKGTLRGIALSGVVTAAGDSITGAATGLGMVRAGDRIHGLALAGLTCLSPEVVGVSTGIFNGAMVQRISLEEFVVINKANHRTTGLAIGLVNYTRQLRGVQIGLLNWAGNNPPWLRLLPFANVHI